MPKKSTDDLDELGTSEESAAGRHHHLSRSRRQDRRHQRDTRWCSVPMAKATFASRTSGDV